MYRMVVKKARNLTLAEKRSCYAMSYGNNGDLHGWLYNSKVNGGNDDVVLYKEDDKVVGWAMRLEKSGSVGYWVRRSHRRKGIGTKLVKRTEKLGRIMTHPHDLASAKLFRKTQTFPTKESQKTWESYIVRVEIDENSERALLRRR